MVLFAAMSAYTVPDPPSDGVSCVTFSARNPELLLACSWDTTVRCYDLSAASSPLVASLPQPSACLATTFAGDDATAVVGSVDGSVRVCRVDGARSGGSGSALGAHDAGVRCLCHDEETGLVFSGSWDRTLGAWDPRSASARVATCSVPGKVFALDVAPGPTRLVAGTSDRHVLVFDARKLDAPLQHRESSLKHQTRCLRSFPGGDGFAVSSIEGRVAVEYFADEAQSRKYAFKCHRVGKVVYPVNALAFHPVHGTFATGGSDGFVNLWDGAHKKRLCQLPQFPTSVAALAFNCDGSKLAVASSYCFEEGEKDHPKDEIYVHATRPHEVTPKAQPPPSAATN